MMSKTVMQSFAQELVDARCKWSIAIHSGSQEAWSHVLEEKGFWSVSHGDLSSIGDMNDKALCQSIVEDVLTALDGKVHGAFGVYPLEQLERFIPSYMVSRTLNALASVVNMGLVIYKDGLLAIKPGREREAMNYSGVYYDLNNVDDAGNDFVDDLLSVGGVELLAEELDDIAHKINLD